VLLYELVVGRTPFASDRPQVLLSQHIKAPPPPPRSLDPRIPETLEAVILRLLAKRPAERFPTADAVRRALDQVAQGELPPLAPAGTPAVINAPAEQSALIGRGADVERARVLLLDPDTAIVTLTGPGGTGKTRLAVRLAA